MANSLEVRNKVCRAKFATLSPYSSILLPSHLITAITSFGASENILILDSDLGGPSPNSECSHTQADDPSGFAYLSRSQRLDLYFPLYLSSAFFQKTYRARAAAY
jgi:hypothetical protein